MRPSALFLLAATALLLVPPPAIGQAVTFDAWARATAPGATTGAIYGWLENVSDEPLHLQSAHFDGAGHVMLHRTLERQGIMRMIHAEIELAPGETVGLAPGGLHIMLMRLAEPLVQSCTYSVMLEWSNGSRTEHSVVTGSFGQSKKPQHQPQHQQKGQPCN